MTYWGYRIDKENTRFFFDELKHNRLRQGWGYESGQDLRNMTEDKGAARNLRMLEVKKGDVLIISRMPDEGSVTVARATEDWAKGYKNMRLMRTMATTGIYSRQSMFAIYPEEMNFSKRLKERLTIKEDFGKSVITTLTLKIL